MAKCLECTHWKPCFNGKEWDAAIASPCKYFAPDIVVGGMTNSEKLRAMSDEELAECIGYGCPVDHDGCLYDGMNGCDKCWLRWLKQPAREADYDVR